MTIQTEVVIVGAGPCGLFQVFELGLLGIKAHLLDSLPGPGGQCAELYPEKPIYDIPALPVCGAQELVDRLLEQIKPFGAVMHFGHEVTEVTKREDGRFDVATATGLRFDAGAVIIAGGVGSFQPRRLGVEGADRFEGTQIHYRVKAAAEFHGAHLVIFGGGDSALDWTLALADKAASMTLVHRRSEFRAAPASVAKMQELVAAGRMRFIEGMAQSLVTAGEKLAGVVVKDAAGTVHELSATPIDAVALFTASPNTLSSARLAPRSAAAPTIFSTTNVPATARRPVV
jgi:thioredoxin reductase (NADPH)